jgi:HK97 family phage portal protein
MIFTAGRFALRASLKPFSFEMRSNLSDPDRWLIEYAGGHPTASGMTITERTAVQISGVYRAVNLISDSLAISPLQLFEKQTEGRKQITDHPLAKVLKHPNEEMTAFTFRKTIEAHALLWGNGYAEIERNGGGEVMALWPLRPDRTFPRRMENGKLVYAARADKGPEVILQPFDVLHVVGYTYDGLRGLSPVALHRETLGLSSATQDYGARFFGNDARPGGILKTPGIMNKMARDRLKESWEEAHRGGVNSHRVVVAEQGLEWQSIGMPNEDAQFLQTRVFQLSEIARIFGVPLHKLAELSHATFSNIEHQSIEYVKDAVMPWACAWEEEIERKCLNPVDQDRLYVEHNLDGQMRGDMESRYKAYQIAIQTGMRSPDDVGELENWNPQPNGQGKTYWMLGTLRPVEQALEPPEPADPAAQLGPDGKPLKQLPVAPPPVDKKKKAKQAAGQRVQLALAYASVLEVVGERLARKETAALTRIFGYKKDSRDAELAKFFSDHTEYVREAMAPALSRFFLSVGTLCGSSAVQLPEGYVSGVAHRYVEAARAHLPATRDLAGWQSAIGQRCRYEAMLASNAFALLHYTAAEIAEVILVRSDREACKGCSSEDVIAFNRAQRQPPTHPECECQIVAIES